MTDFLDNVRESHTDLEKLELMCTTLTDIRGEIEKAEAVVKDLKKRENKLSEFDIPDFLLTKGISSLSLDNGRKVDVKQDIKISISKTDPDKKKIVLDFLKQNGGEDIIKDILTINSPEETIKQFLIENNVPFSNEDTVHAQTLKAFFNDLLGLKKNSIPKVNIEDIPKEANLYIYKKTIIK